VDTTSFSDARMISLYILPSTCTCFPSLVSTGMSELNLLQRCTCVERCFSRKLTRVYSQCSAHVSCDPGRCSGAMRTSSSCLTRCPDRASASLNPEYFRCVELSDASPDKRRHCMAASLAMYPNAPNESPSQPGKSMHTFGRCVCCI
jgi:hypothetical protein